MGNDNVLMTTRVKIPCDDNGPIRPAHYLVDVLVNEPRLYSWLIRTVTKDGRIISFEVQFIVSQTERYNTINRTEAIVRMVELMSKEYSESMKVIGYEQPPLDLLVEIFDPLVHKLAQQQHELWPIEIEDLEQMCRLTICTLYTAGYYIHKHLLSLAFTRDVLQYMRKIRKDVKHISFSNLGKEDKNYLADVKDESSEERMHEYEEEQSENQIVETRRSIALSETGQGKYDYLIRAIDTRTMTSSDYTYVARLRKRLKKKYKGEI